MFDVIDRRRQGALKLGRHAAGHLIPRQPGVLPDHRDYRDPDVRKDVDGCAQGGERTDDENDQGEHDERVGTLKCNADKGYHAADVSWSGGMPCAVSMQGASAYGDGGPCRIAQNRSDFFSMTIHKCVPIPSSYVNKNDSTTNNCFSSRNRCGRQPGSTTRRLCEGYPFGWKRVRPLGGARRRARPAHRADGYSTGAPKGPRSMSSMRVPQGSLIYVMLLPVGLLRAGSSSLMPSASIFFTKAAWSFTSKPM